MTADRHIMADDQTKCSHTPGPWMVGNVGQREDPRMVYCDDSLGSRVADCSTSGHGLTVEQDLANARLIAAAPDLYATLNDVLDSFDRQTMEEMLRKDNDAHDDDEFCVNLTAKQLRAINQAILKAEGKV